MMSTGGVSYSSTDEIQDPLATVGESEDVDQCEESVPSADFTVPQIELTTEKLEAEIKQCSEILRIYLTDDWRKGYAILKANQRQGFYYMSGVAVTYAIAGGFGVDKARLDTAMRMAVECIEFIKSHRKNESAIVFFKAMDPNSYSDVECSAEHMYAEAMLAYAMLTVGVDQSIMGFIKGAIRMRTGFNTIKHCERILAAKTNWQSEQLRQEFECSINACLGLFDMVISFFPRRFITLLQMAGFSGDRMNGLARLEHSALMKGTIRQPPVLSIVILYYTAGEFFYGLGEPDVPKVKSLLNDYLADNGTGMSADAAQAVLATFEGDFDRSNAWFNTFMSRPDVPKKIHFASLLFQSCTYALQWNWTRALECMEVLKNDCKWSRALFAYSWAAFASMLVDEQGRVDLIPAIAETMASVPSLKRHFGGKKAFHEMLVIEKSKRFADNVSRMVLAPFDLIYLGNGFELASYNPNSQYLDKIVEKVEAKLGLYPKSCDVNVYGYLTFIKAAALSKSSGRRDEAHSLFLEVLKLKDQLSDESHLVPQACYEIGRLYRAMGDRDQAKLWLTKAIRYSGYLTETMIKYRATVALESIAK